MFQAGLHRGVSRVAPTTSSDSGDPMGKVQSERLVSYRRLRRRNVRVEFSGLSEKLILG
ncbi:unnamed protein product [uncultured bacterium]|nr:unnamed protein product [uncultured bacterium]